MTTGRELDVSVMLAQRQLVAPCGAGLQGRVHPQAPHGGEGPVNAPVRGCLSADRDTRLTLNARKRGNEDEQAVVSRGYHPRHGARHDSSEDRSPSPGPSSPRVFSSRIRNAAFPPWYRHPARISKYAGETNPGLWLEYYRLAYRADGVDSDYFIIHNLPLFLADSARMWLEHLPSNWIQNWSDLKEIYVGNFQGTYCDTLSV
jgi:hypothetical protein